jgi:hypothetical protein
MDWTDRQTEWVLGNGMVLYQARQTEGAWERYGALPSQTDRGYWERCSTNQTDRQTDRQTEQKIAGFAILISAAENIGALNNITAGTEQ